MHEAGSENFSGPNKGGVIDIALFKNHFKAISFLNSEEINGPGVDFAQSDGYGWRYILVRKGFIKRTFNGTGHHPLHHLGGALYGLNIQAVQTKYDVLRLRGFVHEILRRGGTVRRMKYPISISCAPSALIEGSFGHF